MCLRLLICSVVPVCLRRVLMQRHFSVLYGRVLIGWRLDCSGFRMDFDEFRMGLSCMRLIPMVLYVCSLDFAWISSAFAWI